MKAFFRSKGFLFGMLFGAAFELSWLLYYIPLIGPLLLGLGILRLIALLNFLQWPLIICSLGDAPLFYCRLVPGVIISIVTSVIFWGVIGGLIEKYKKPLFKKI
jgi:hypothetical protein